MNGAVMVLVRGFSSKVVWDCKILRLVCLSMSHGWGAFLIVWLERCKQMMVLSSVMDQFSHWRAAA